MTRTVNLSNTQFRHQLVFFVHKYGWLKVAFAGQNLQWHLLPRQNMLRRYVLTGGMILLIQRILAFLLVVLS